MTKPTKTTNAAFKCEEHLLEMHQEQVVSFHPGLLEPHINNDLMSVIHS